MKRVYFSKVCNQTGINSKFDEKGMYRYSLTVPFKNRENGIHAIVLLKNPSNAGRRTKNNKYISDDTVYRVLDYLYKLEENIYSRVTILNLFPHVAGETKKLKK